MVRQEGFPLRHDATPFIPTALLVAMRYKARLIVDGEVSPLLLSSLDAAGGLMWAV